MQEREQRHQLAQLLEGSKKLPFPSRNQNFSWRLRFGEQSEESFLTTQKGVRGQKTQLTHKGQYGVCCGSRGVLWEPKHTQQGSLPAPNPSSSRKPIPADWKPIPCRLLHRPGIEPTGGAASAAALGKALQDGAETRTSMDPFCHIFWSPVHREDPITCSSLHRKSTSCTHP